MKKMIVGTLFLCSLYIPSAAAATTDFLGFWRMGTDVTKKTKIVKRRGRIFVVNEHGNRQRAFVNGIVIRVPGWGHLRGRLVLNKKAILWQNGTWWSKRTVRLGASKVKYNKLKGVWRRGICKNNRGYCLVRSGRFVTNEHGDSTRVRVSRFSNKIVAQRWYIRPTTRLVGHVFGTRTILWANGTFWQK